MRLLAPAALACLLGLAPAVAFGGPRACGDDVDGHGRVVPCDCGDVLVSSHTLGDRDPIIRHACPGPGLIVRVPARRPAPTLAFGGHEIVGSRRAAGIAVVGGGAGGLTLVGPGTVRGFDVGVEAGPRTLARVADLTLADNASDGLRAGGAGYVVSRCQARRNGRDGFVLHGTGYRADGNQASENGRAGFRLGGRGATIAGNRAEGNGREGLVLRGREHDVEGPVAGANGGDGIRTSVRRTRIDAAVATGNAGAGLAGSAHDSLIARATAEGNRRLGLRLRGARLGDGAGRMPACRPGAPCR
ncbi:MAG TPA: right-handed parallel beta-helix repeat-containing protein [Candidatus Binatia bacterium]|nr:right-handed parallel beta-helix repeat-containing protein [Candidatus Binatia bacterium]